MPIRDRIRELRRVPAAQLRPNPLNWRLHPEPQRAALREILAEIGYSAALIVRELPDGGLELIDGHLRAETTPDELVPVLVLDVTGDEARRLLAVLDPLAAAAETDAAALQALLDQARLDSPALKALFEAESPKSTASPVEPRELFQLLIDCPTEADQQELFERLSAEGWKTRALVL